MGIDYYYLSPLLLVVMVFIVIPMKKSVSTRICQQQQNLTNFFFKSKNQINQINFKISVQSVCFIYHPPWRAPWPSASDTWCWTDRRSVSDPARSPSHGTRTRFVGLSSNRG